MRDQSGYLSSGMGIKALLNLLVGLAVFASLSVGALSLWGAKTSTTAATQTFVSKDLTADILPPPLYLIEMRLVLSQAIEGTLPVNQAQVEFNRLRSEYDNRIAYWKAHPPYGLEAQLLGEQHQQGQEFVALVAKTLARLASGASQESLRTDLDAAQKVYLAHRAGVDATVKKSVAFADSSISQYDDTIRSTTKQMAAVITFAAIAVIGFGIWIRRSVLSSVGGEPVFAAGIARAVAHGDLTVEVPVGPNDGQSIMAALSEMQKRLALLVGKVRHGSESVANASYEIAQGSGSLSTRTERQASSLEETAASMEQLTATVGQTAGSAQQASQLAVVATQVASKGGEAVLQAVGIMKEINESSRKISDIIGVIDGIAFQTNILALNAAVEAARAGEEGRGFAVVASEVRSLAGRSALAAKEIKTLINASLARVEKGNLLVENAGNTMGEVVRSINQLTHVVGEISHANSEQSIGCEQVSDVVKHMDMATQQNAALVEEMAAAAGSLNSQAQDLVQLVSIFKIHPTELLPKIPGPANRDGLIDGLGQLRLSPLGA